MRRRTTLQATILVAFLAAAIVPAFPSGSEGVTIEAGAAPYVGPDARPVDLVICLDNSGSMKDLLDGVRFHLWDVVNELATLQPTPALRVGLITFGDRSAAGSSGWILKHSDLTHDLDLVYSRLAELENTRGGVEYVGWALHTAVDTMRWSDDAEALKIVFVAGNESVDQGADHHDFREVAARARAREILVNTLYAGERAQGIEELWLELAETGGGRFVAVGRSVPLPPRVATPYDARLAELNTELNASYVPYGPRGRQGLANQEAQDAHASELGAIADRIATKGSPLYDNSSWDLVDASRRPDFDWTRLQEDELPEELRGIEPMERSARIEAMRAEREAIRRQIRKLGLERAAHLRTQRGGESPDTGLGSAMRDTLRRQAEERGFYRED